VIGEVLTAHVGMLHGVRGTHGTRREAARRGRHILPVRRALYCCRLSMPEWRNW
jgi:hypothetical protein